MERLDCWQYEYAVELLRKGRASIEEERKKLIENIKLADKRTYNGKMAVAFDQARLYVVEKCLEI